MEWIIRGSLRFRFLLAFFAAALVIIGLDQVREARMDVFPEFAPPVVEVQTDAQGLSTEETEALVTVPLEQAFNGMPLLETIRSKTVPGLSDIVMLFQRGTDVVRARQLVQERLEQVQAVLPNVTRPPIIIPPLSSTSRVVKVGLSSTTMSLIEMSELYRWSIRPKLMQVRGVANIAAWGARKRQMQIQVDPERLRAFGVTLDQVLENATDALAVGVLSYENGAKTGTGGFIDGPDQRLQIRHILPTVKPEDLSRMTFAAADGTMLRIGDIARVVEGHPPVIGDGIVNDDAGLLLVVEKFPWANTLEVTEGVETALAALKPGLPGITIDSTIFRPASFIEQSIRNLSNTLVVGSVLVVLVLLAFLYAWRAAVVSLVAIPLSLMSAALVLYWSGATINTMILAGFAIALGEVVDDAIIDIENIMRRLRENRSAKSPRSAAAVIFDASLEIRSSVIYATLIIVLAISPVLFMSGLSGAFFRPLATAYVLALLASMVVALTVTPALSLILLRGSSHARGESPLVHGLRRIYEAILPRLLAAPRVAFVATGAVVLLGLALLPLLGQSLMPSFKERDFLMHWITTPGTSYPEMKRIETRVSKELRATPGIRNVGAHLGRAVAGEEIVSVNFTENWISVNPDADYDKTLAKIREIAESYPGLYRDVQTYLKERVEEVLTGASEAIVVRIFGPDLHVLHDKANEVRDALKGIDGIIELHTELQEDIPHISIKVDLAAAERYGIKPGDVRRAASVLIGGIEVSDVYPGAQLYDVLVWGVPEVRSDLTAIRNLLIDTPRDGHVRLGEIADVRIIPTPNVIKRENDSRRIDVGANVAGRDLGSVAQEVERRLQGIHFPLEYHAELVGEYAEEQAAHTRLLGLAIAAAVGIFLLLQAAFGSWRLAAMAFLALPSALVGGVLAALASGGVISLGSLVGFLTVLGIAARNGILMIKHFQHLERDEGEAFGPALILRGARERLRPILMTALTTGLAISPLVLLGEIPGQEIEHPMAAVIMGGLVTSTLLNLFVVPILYARFGGGGRPAPATSPTRARRPAVAPAAS